MSVWKVSLSLSAGKNGQQSCHLRKLKMKQTVQCSLHVGLDFRRHQPDKKFNYISELNYCVAPFVYPKLPPSISQRSLHRMYRVISRALSSLQHLNILTALDLSASEPFHHVFVFPNSRLIFFLQFRVIVESFNVHWKSLRAILLC